MFIAIRFPPLSLAETSAVTNSSVRHMPALHKVKIKAATHPSISGKNIPVEEERKKIESYLLLFSCYLRAAVTLVVLYGSCLIIPNT